MRKLFFRTMSLTTTPSRNSRSGAGRDTAGAFGLSEQIKALGLDDRDWQILRARINSGRTLKRIGETHHVTRERVRQLLKDIERQLCTNTHRLEPFFTALEDRFTCLWMSFDRHTTIDIAVDLAWETLKAAGVETATASDVDKLILSMRAVVAFKFDTVINRWPNLSFAACSLEPPVMEHPKVTLTVEKKKLSYMELARSVLERANAPLHWSDIFASANHLSDRALIPASLYNALTTHDIFVRVGPGTYGLSAWGLSEVEYYPDIIADILTKERKPLSFGILLSRVNSIRLIEKTSLLMFLETHVRFYRSLENTYGMRVWLKPRERQSLRTPKSHVEPRDSYERVARAQERGYDADRILAHDRELLALPNS